VGEVKAAGNYAPCFKASLESKSEGFDEVLYLDGRSDRFVEEVFNHDHLVLIYQTLTSSSQLFFKQAGASNFFVVVGGIDDGTLYTPGLHRGSILPGVTRTSLITLARDSGLKVRFSL
jgi:branched-chain amino acid aminotransferase